MHPSELSHPWARPCPAPAAPPPVPRLTDAANAAAPRDATNPGWPRVQHAGERRAGPSPASAPPAVHGPRRAGQLPCAGFQPLPRRTDGGGKVLVSKRGSEAPRGVREGRGEARPARGSGEKGNTLTSAGRGRPPSERRCSPPPPQAGTRRSFCQARCEAAGPPPVRSREPRAHLKSL